MNGNSIIPTEAEHDDHYEPNPEEEYALEIPVTPLALRRLQNIEKQLAEIQKTLVKKI